MFRNFNDANCAQIFVEIDLLIFNCANPKFNSSDLS